MAHVNEHLPSARPARLPSRASDERGFTLVESMVAMIILTVGLVALAGLLSVSLRMQQLGRNGTQAVRLAQDKLDELSALNFGPPPGTAVADPRIAIGGSLTANAADHWDTPLDVNGNALPYIRRWVVTAGPDSNPNLRQVTIRLIPTRTDTRTNSPFEMITIIRRI